MKSLLRLNEIGMIEKIAQIKHACPMAVKQRLNGISFFRGVESEEGFIYHDPRGKFRKSKDSNNFSLLYSGINPDWAKIPPRYSSVIFTSSESTAGDYGSVHDVFVEGDDPIVAYGNASDNYFNYKAGFNLVGVRLNRNVGDLDTVMGIIIPIILADTGIVFYTMNTPSKLQTILDKLDGELAHMSEDDIRNTTFAKSNILDPECVEYVLLIKRLGIHNFLRTIFNPKLNNIRVCPLSKFPLGLFNVEVWTGCPAYLVDTRYRGEFQ